MEENQATSGAATDTSGSEAVENKTETQESNPLVAKLKKEKDNYAKSVHQLKQEVEALKSQAIEGEKDELVKEQKYKTLYEQSEQRASTLEQQLASRDQERVEAKKMDAIKTHLSKYGLKPEHEKTAFKLMDRSQVFIDDETGVVIGDEEAAKSFYEDHKTLGLFGQKVPGVSHQAPNQPERLNKSVKEMSKEDIIAKLKSMD